MRVIPYTLYVSFSKPFSNSMKTFPRVILQITPSSKLDPCQSALEEVQDNLNSLIVGMDEFLGKGEIIQAAQLGTLALKSAKESKNTKCGQSLPSDVQNNVSSKVNAGESFDLHFSLCKPSIIIMPKKGKK